MTSNGWLGIFFVIGFIAFMAQAEIRHRRAAVGPSSVKADPRILAVLIEQQAKIDSQTTAIRALLMTHPQKADFAILLRAAVTHLNAASATNAPDTHPLYEATLRSALENLVNEE